jgi:serine/threonine protein kinase
MLPSSAQALEGNNQSQANNSANIPDSPKELRIFGERFVLQAEISRGSATSIYRAIDRHSGRTVALRVFNQRIQADPRFAIRFRQRMLAIAGMDHENLVAVLDYGVLDGRSFIAMEWISGVDLRTYLVEHGPLSGGLAAWIALKVCAALDAVHRSGLDHRGIKPQNVLLTASGEVKVSDVGLNGLYSESGLSRTNVMAAGIGFMSPEQARGEDVGPQSDIYSLGVLLFEMLTNRLPFESKDAWEVLRMHANEQPLAPFQDEDQLQIPALLHAGADRGLLARMKNRKRLYALAKFIIDPSPEPLQKLPFWVLLAAIFVIGLAASFLFFYLLFGIVQS